MQVWRIEDLELVPVEPQWHGFFYGGDCYLVLYTYEVHSKLNYLLYMWQVRELPAIVECIKLNPFICNNMATKWHTFRAKCLIIL